MKWISILLFFCLHIYAEDLGVAPLDPDYESRFYSIYKNYHSRQMSSAEWQGLISQKNINTYTMQKGDNLWDISRMLFDNSNHWPKLWSVNADLSNPHRISAGYKVQIIMGSEGQVPRAVIKGGQAVTIPVSPSAKNSADGLLQQDGSTLPLGADNVSETHSCVKNLGLILHKKGSTKVYDSKVKCKALKKKLHERKVKDAGRLKKYYVQQLKEGEETGLEPFARPSRLGAIPSSMPPVQLTPAKSIDLVGLGRNLSVSSENVVLNYQVSADDIEIVGNVFDIPDGISVPTSEIIVELDVPAQTGELFSVIRPIRRLSKSSLFISGPVGHEVVFQAQIKITGSVPNRTGLYFVEVMNMYDEVNEKSKIIREAPSVFDFRSRLQSGQTRAQITAIPDDQSSLALTVHSFIYINRGKNNNVNVGDAFNIQANPRFHNRAFGKPLGRAIIVHTSGDFSTGFVTNLNDVSYPGDYLDPLNSAVYVSDSEADDVYEVDEEEDRYEEDEEEEFAEGDRYEENTVSQEQSEDPFEEGVDNSSVEEELEESPADEFEDNEAESALPEEKEDVSDEEQEDIFLDDFEDEEQEWGE